MRRAWKVRVAVSIRLYPFRGTARLTMSASRPVVAIGAWARAATIERAIRRE